MTSTVSAVEIGAKIRRIDDLFLTPLATPAEGVFGETVVAGQTGLGGCRLGGGGGKERIIRVGEIEGAVDRRRR